MKNTNILKASEASMTFQDIIDNASDFVGGNLTTHEGDLPGYNTRIVGFSLDKDIFKVHTTCGGEVSAAVELSKPTAVNDRIVKFNIPYVGVAFITKVIRREQPQRVFTL